jgi:hypothetical protein
VQAIYAAEVLFVLAHTLSKVSLALFVRRLFTHNRRLNAILCWSLLGFTIAWGVVALFVLLIKCSPDHFFSSGATSCRSYVSMMRPTRRHTAHRATDCPMESCDSVRYHHRSRAYDCSFLPGLRCYDRLASEVACHDCICIQTRVSEHLGMRCIRSDKS